MIRNIVQWFLYLRYVAIPIWIIFSIVATIVEGSNQYFKSNYGMVVYVIVTIDALLIFILYFFGIISICKNKKLKSIMESKQLKKIRYKYYWVLGSTLFRVIFFIIINP